MNSPLGQKNAKLIIEIIFDDKEVLYSKFECLKMLQWRLTIHFTLHFLRFRPDGIATVTHEEKEMYLMVKDRLMALIEFQLTNFR